MNAFTLYTIVSHQLILLVDILLFRNLTVLFLFLQSRKLRSDVRQNEQFRVFGLLSEPSSTFISKVSTI